MPKPSRKPALYAHRLHPEWGHGLVVEENPAKIYVAFEDGVRRPFLNEPRFRDQLVPVALAPGLVAGRVAEIEKAAGVVSPATVRKLALRAAKERAAARRAASGR